MCGTKKMSKKKKTEGVPVYLNVYDLTSINGYAYWFGLGIYHSGVQVHDTEYAFGAHDLPTTGVFEVVPTQCPGFRFRKSIMIGRTELSPREIRTFMENLAVDYPGNSYHLITKNCNHFCDDVCKRLTGKSIPSWVNRLARLGLFCNCFLPAELNERKVRVRSAKRPSGGEKKKLRSHSSRFASTSSSPGAATRTCCSDISVGKKRRHRRGLPTELIYSDPASTISKKV